MIAASLPLLANERDSRQPMNCTSSHWCQILFTPEKQLYGFLMKCPGQKLVILDRIATWSMSSMNEWIENTVWFFILTER